MLAAEEAVNKAFRRRGSEVKAEIRTTHLSHPPNKVAGSQTLWTPSQRKNFKDASVRGIGMQKYTLTETDQGAWRGRRVISWNQKHLRFSYGSGNPRKVAPSRKGVGQCCGCESSLFKEVDSLGTL